MDRYALDGVRIIDFGQAWAGPYASQLLGFLGAEVIKVESRKRLDVSRLRSDAMSGEASDIESSTMFHDANMNKMSVTLDLTHPRGKELTRRLVAVSDVVVENFRPGVMDRLGLGYENLRKIREDIIMVSVSACGQTGPARSYAGYATIFNALSGLGALTGYHDGPPTEIRGGIDLRVGTTAAVAIAGALCHRLRSGSGQHVDLSAWEAISCLIGDFILGYQMDGKELGRVGNHDDQMVPHNCYPCRGEDKWVSIAVSSEAEWQAFCRAIGKPEWAGDTRFADGAARKRNEEELDGLVGQWTVTRSAYQVTEVLQAAGVAAFPVMTGPDIFADPHLKAREFAAVIEHPRMGKRTVVSAPWKLSATPAGVRIPAPMLGEHNSYVFEQLLGVPAREVEAMIQEGVIN